MYLKFLHPLIKVKQAELMLAPKYLKYCAAPVLQVICHLFSTSLQNNSIVQEWRTHCVILIYKTGDKSSVCNY